MSKTTREKIIQGYHEWVEERLASSHPEGYFANFMFNQLGGGHASRIAQMHRAVTRFHGLLTKHVVRKPESESWKHLRPIVIGVQDLPVRKRERVTSKPIQVNSGLHFNAIVLLPSRASPTDVSELRRSRLKVSLDEHVREKAREYLTGRLYRIHVTPIETGTMVDYAFKTYRVGHFDDDAILPLN